MKNILLLVVMAVGLSGCATMFSGSSQNLLVRSEVQGSKLYLNNEPIGTDTATVQISKKNLSSSVLTAKKEGCTDYSTHINTKFDPTSLLGILVDWGLVSILVVDLAVSGAAHEAERTNYVLNPTCKTSQAGN